MNIKNVVATYATLNNDVRFLNKSYELSISSSSSLFTMLWASSRTYVKLCDTERKNIFIFEF